MSEDPPRFVPPAPSDLDPPAPPGLPPEPHRRLDRGVLPVWIAGGLGSALAAAILASIAVPVLGEVEGLPGWVRPALVVLVAVYGLLAVAVLPLARYRAWRFAVRPDEIDLVRGPLVRRRTIIPMARVQHVDSGQTPVGRLFDLATLTIHTAAAQHTIPGLPEQLAYRLRTEIARRARVADEV